MIDKEILEKFYSIGYTLNGDCHIWNGYIDKHPKSGYGSLSFKGKSYSTHRIACEIGNGESEGKWALHSCNNRSCCNPDHLRWGTNRDNVNDRVCGGKNLKGEDISQKLTNEDVLEIKKTLKNPFWGQIRYLAKKYNVSTTTISHIKSEKLWSHIK